jgi:hypothetical protein
MWGEIERRRSDSSTSGTFHQSDPRARRDASLNRPRFALFPRLRALAAISLLFGFGLVAAPPPAQANWGGFCGPGGCPTLSAAIDSIIAARPNSYLHYSTWEGNSLRLCVGYFVQLKCTWNDLVSPVCPAGEEASRTAENGCALVQQASNGDACTPPAPNTPGDSTTRARPPRQTHPVTALRRGTPIRSTWRPATSSSRSWTSRHRALTSWPSSAPTTA